MSEAGHYKTELIKLNNTVKSLINSEINEGFQLIDQIDCNVSEINELKESIKTLIQKYSESKEFLDSLSKGNLSVTPPAKNVFISPFKELHSVLKNLIFQINSIADGNLNQPPSFMGDFSNAINLLIDTLKEKKELKEWLEISELKYRSLFSQMTDAFALHEIILENEVPVDYKFIEVNSAFFEMTGLVNSDIIGKKVTEIIPNISKEWIERYGAIALNGGTDQFSQYSPELDKYYLINVYCPAFGQFATVFSDVTRIKKYEEEIQEARMMLQLVLDHIPQGVFWKDSNLNYLGCNITTSAHAGLKNPSEIVGKSDYDLRWKALADEYRKDDKLVITSKEPKLNYEELIKYDDGNYVWVRTNKIPLFNENNKSLGILGTYEDITIQKEAERKIKKANDDLRETVATKDKFFSIIAHDLKSPFQGLLGYSQILSEEYESLTSEEIQSFANGIYDISRQSLNMLDNLLNWSRMQTGSMAFNPEFINLRNSLGSTIDLLTSTALNKQITLNNKIEKGAFITADLNMIVTIIRNLISNSIKFTNQNGLIEISSEQTKNKLRIIILDNGIGIEEDRVKDLFRIDKSTSTKGTSNEEGTGLGLVLCKEMVEKNGGTISVTSEIGKGTKFILEFNK